MVEVGMFKYLGITFAGLLVWSTYALSAPLQSSLLSTADVPCGSIARPVTDEWRNPLRNSVRITNIHVGMTPDNPRALVDIHTLLTRKSDGMVLANDRWNLYTPQNSWISSRTDFAPNWVEVPPGDSIVLRTYCIGYGPIYTSAKGKAYLWWTTE